MTVVGEEEEEEEVEVEVEVEVVISAGSSVGPTASKFRAYLSIHLRGSSATSLMDTMCVCVIIISRGVIETHCYH